MQALVPPVAIIIAGAFLLSLTWFGALLVVFGIIDTRGRYKDWRYLSQFNYLTERLALFYGRSYCGRWLVCAIDPRWDATYASQGYKWWHFMPDNFPRFLVNPRFWRALVGGHRTT